VEQAAFQANVMNLSIPFRPVISVKFLSRCSAESKFSRFQDKIANTLLPIGRGCKEMIIFDVILQSILISKFSILTFKMAKYHTKSFGFVFDPSKSATPIPTG
jgi:hypothetical protein